MVEHIGKGPSKRQLRVGEELRHALAALLARDEVRDPDLQGVSLTVTAVDVSPDLRNATAFVVPLGGDPDGKVIPALRRATAFLRGRLGRALTLKYVPQLRIEYDRSFDQASQIDSVLRQPRVARDLDAPNAAED